MVQIFVMGDSVMCSGSDGEQEGPHRDASVNPNANPAVNSAMCIGSDGEQEGPHRDSSVNPNANPAVNSAPKKKKKSRAKKGMYKH
jgi:hypothetical protein